MLVGEAGVGKTAIVEGLALAVAAGTVPAQLVDKRVIVLDVPAMLAGTRTATRSSSSSTKCTRSSALEAAATAAWMRGTS